MNVEEASEAIREKLGKVLKKDANSTTSIRKEGTNWNATVEVIEEHYLSDFKMSSQNDIIGVYDVEMDDKGELLQWHKQSSRKRSDITTTGQA